MQDKAVVKSETGELPPPEMERVLPCNGMILLMRDLALVKIVEPWLASTSKLYRS